MWTTSLLTKSLDQPVSLRMDDFFVLLFFIFGYTVAGTRGRRAEKDDDDEHKDRENKSAKLDPRRPLPAEQSHSLKNAGILSRLL